jgi:hypothetical protein
MEQAWDINSEPHKTLIQEDARKIKKWRRSLGKKKNNRWRPFFTFYNSGSHLYVTTDCDPSIPHRFGTPRWTWLRFKDWTTSLNPNRIPGSINGISVFHLGHNEKGEVLVGISQDLIKYKWKIIPPGYRLHVIHFFSAIQHKLQFNPVSHKKLHHRS